VGTSEAVPGEPKPSAIDEQNEVIAAEQQARREQEKRAT
jgi:hypothetical protein